MSGKSRMSICLSLSLKMLFIVYGCKFTKKFRKLFVFGVKSRENRAKRRAMPNVWYAKCHEMAIVGVQKSPYLCTIEMK